MTKTQTDSKKYEGQCKFCKQDFTKRQINKHLNQCDKRKKGNEKNLRLQIIDPYFKNMWLMVEVKPTATFKQLDQLLRAVWLECCGHMSMFGTYDNEISMSRKIMDILEPKDKLNYEYDFGSTTQVVIEALEYTESPLSKSVELVARNYLPISNCIECEKPATLICGDCLYNGDSEELTFLCKNCIEDHTENHGCDEDMMLPISNSPRCGVCGYKQTEPLDQLF